MFFSKDEPKASELIFPALGCELEFALVCTRGRVGYVNPIFVHGDIRRKYVRGGISHPRNFYEDYPLPNGSRFYLDPAERIDSRYVGRLSQVLEVATPSSQVPSRTANYILATTSIFCDPELLRDDDEVDEEYEIIFEQNRLEHEMVIRGGNKPNFRLGFHQNMSIPDAETGERMKREMVYFLASMCLMVGEGKISDNGTLMRSQRGQVIASEKVEKSSGFKDVEYCRVMERRADRLAENRNYKLEFRSNDFPTAKKACLLSNGMLMIAGILHRNNLAPDISHIVGEKSSIEDANAQRKIFGYFSGSIDVYESFDKGIDIQKLYLEAARKIIKILELGKVRRSFENVIDIWQSAIDQAELYMQCGVIVENPISGWLEARRRQIEYEKNPFVLKELFFRRIADVEFNGAKIWFNNVHPSSNRYFAMQLEKKLDTNIFRIQHSWNQITVAHKHEYIPGATVGGTRGVTLDMTIGSNVGTAEWVKLQFGTFHPSADQINEWALNFTRQEISYPPPLANFALNIAR